MRRRLWRKTRFSATAIPSGLVRDELRSSVIDLVQNSRLNETLHPNAHRPATRLTVWWTIPRPSSRKPRCLEGGGRRNPNEYALKLKLRQVV